MVAAAAVAVLISGGAPKIEGGGFIQRIDISTPEKWCEFYGVEVRDGIALLGKCVQKDFTSYRKAPDGSRVLYSPGETPQAKDWDGGDVECGKGLHFSPTPSGAHEFAIDYTAEHDLICPTRLSDMAVHPDGTYPQKVKASGCAAPIWEVNRRGEPIDEASRRIRDAFFAAHAAAVDQPSEKKAKRNRMKKTRA